MKRYFYVFMILIGLSSPFAYSQSPNAFQYQAVLRNSNGEPIINTEVNLKISILSDTVLNLVQYAEIHNVLTDAVGKVAIQVGKGSQVTGSFDYIDWAAGQYFIKVELDPTAGNEFQDFGTSQLLSVPYALYSNQSGNSLLEGQGIDITGDVISNTGDLSNSNEIQTLSRLGSSIILSLGGGVVTDSDNQSLSMIATGTNRQIQISNGNNITINVADNDNSITNELQVISISNDTVFLSNGGFAKLPIPENAIVPQENCIQSANQNPPAGYVYSGSTIQAGDDWNTLSPMTYNRFSPVVAAVNNKIYVIGGWDGNSAVSTKVEVYDLQTQSWSVKANMPFGVVYAAAATVGNLIYVMGGYDGTNTVNKNQVYNTLTNTWYQSTLLPSPRSGGKAAEISGKIYLIGGYYNSSVLNANEMFDPSTGIWTTKVVMTTARTDFALASLNGGIFVIGGWSTDVLNNNEFYNPSTNTWTTCYPMPSYRSGCACGVANNKIYVIAGGDSYSYSSKVEEYDPLTNEWKTMNYIPQPRSYSGAVVISNKIYLAGGNYGLALNSLLEYNPAKIRYYMHCVQ